MFAFIFYIHLKIWSVFNVKWRKKKWCVEDKKKDVVGILRKKNMRKQLKEIKYNLTLKQTTLPLEVKQITKNETNCF